MPSLAEPHCWFPDPDFPRVILLPVFLKYHFHQVNFPSRNPPQLPTPTVQSKFQTPQSALQSTPRPYLTFSNLVPTIPTNPNKCSQTFCSSKTAPHSHPNTFLLYSSPDFCCHNFPFLFQSSTLLQPGPSFQLFKLHLP